MGYFSNGTEGDCYRTEYCFKCVNFTRRPNEDIEGCPIMDMHFCYGYKLCNSKSLAKKMLDMLIPPTCKKINFEGKEVTFPFNDECKMFLPIKRRR